MILYIIITILLILVAEIVSVLCFIFYHTMIREQKYPADASNRINAVRLAWFGVSRPELFYKEDPIHGLDPIKFKNRLDLFSQCLTDEDKFTEVKGFGWIKHDELYNMRQRWSI